MFGHLLPKIPNFFFFKRTSLSIQFCVCDSQKSHKFAKGKFVVRLGKHRNLQFEWVP